MLNLQCPEQKHMKPTTDKEEVRRRNQEWYDDNREYSNDKSKQYYEENRDVIIERTKRNRQKRRQFILDSHGEFCCFCGSTERLEFDHVDTSLKESKDFKVSEVDNLRILCYSCHKKWTAAQNKAAWHLLNSLPFEEREHLINQFYET